MDDCTLSADKSANRIQKSLASPAVAQNEKTVAQVSARLVEVRVPRQLADYLANPKLNPMVRLLIVEIACESSSGEPKAINQPLLIASPGIGRRTCAKFRDATDELEQLGLMTIDRRFRANFGSMHYSCTYPTTEHSHSAQHIVSGTPPENIWMVVDLGFMDDCLALGRKRLNWMSVEATKDSLDSVALVNVPVDDLNLRESAKNQILAKKPRIKPDELSVKADRHVAAIRAAERNPAGGKISRKSGRIYHRLSNLPRWARQLFVRICGETPANVDIRACYFWCVCADLRQRRLKAGLPTGQIDALLDMIEGGMFYERLATRARMSIRGAKASFATLCLFGGPDEHFANNRLWHALKELCPAITDEILRLRHRYRGPSGFARHCQRMEGSIMADGLLMSLHDMGIPCIPIHDGALVRQEHRQLAVDIIKARTAELFGRPCHVSG